MSLPEAKHLPWLLFPTRFLQDICSASIKITPVNAQQLMIKINSFVSSSWTTLWFKCVVVCKWSIKLLCSNFIKLEKFQMPMPSFVFLPSLNLFPNIFSLFSMISKSDLEGCSPCISFPKTEQVSESASIPVHCVFWMEHRSEQGWYSPLKNRRARQKKERKKLMLGLTHLPFSNLSSYNKSLAI